MTEKLFQYIWQFQYFNTHGLSTTHAQTIYIISPGELNVNQGPDFLNAQININEITWVGNVELHINASDWQVHGHHRDSQYDNVILHVVWNANDNKLSIPTLELKGRVSNLILTRYKAMMLSDRFIPCEQLIQGVDKVTIETWKRQLLKERLESSTRHIAILLEKNNRHWEEVLWWMVARNFGVKVNAIAFERIAQSIPFNLLSKHKNQVIQLEALLFGQAGLLEKKFTEDYPVLLQKEYRHLQNKYGLKRPHVPLHFLRMRPAGFPTIRLAQLAMLVNQSSHLFSEIIENESLRKLLERFEITANDYWHYHYLFDMPGTFRKKAIGKEMIRNIFINAIIPMIYAFGYLNKVISLMEKAISWLDSLSPENNKLTRGFEKLGLSNRSAADSQSLLQLKNVYCEKHQCLSCAIGKKILKGE